MTCSDVFNIYYYFKQGYFSTTFVLKLTTFEIFRNSESSIKFTKFGDLDLFLMGIGCQDLRQKFNEHHLGFQDLLIMSDEDLEKVIYHIFVYLLIFCKINVLILKLHKQVLKCNVLFFRLEYIK